MARRTEQREAITRAFQNAHGPLSPKEILGCAQNLVPGMGIATVYRNLRTFVDEGLLIAVSLPGEPDRYQLKSAGVHDHFKCNDCDRVYNVEGSSSEDRVPVGFMVQRAQRTLYGVCAACNKAKTLPALDTPLHQPEAQPVRNVVVHAEPVAPAA